MSEPVVINRLHKVYPNQIIRLVAYFIDTPKGWLEVYEKSGNRYQTELADSPDPQCPVNPEELMKKLERLTNLRTIHKPNGNGRG